ncbi:MAG: ISNCY family transposase [Proteobacteria bacterium]|nr:ISNCY family transposase [Pseudomonadota bacterium]MBU2462032.1 ISNCY family transposase [bacterium]
MEEKDIITMSKREWKRARVIEEVIEKRITQREAASKIDLSERQVRRVVRRVRNEGIDGIKHHLRGKSSIKKIPEQLKDRVIALYRQRYLGFGPTLAQEKLLEIDGIQISRETLRKQLVKEGLWERRHKRTKHRRWRERKDCPGEMVQMDGSHHDWLEGRGTKLVIMAYIDDATSIAYARFYDYEGTIPAMDSFKGYIEQYGIPLKLYLDKHTTYKSNAKLTIEEELEGQKEPKSQFERALEELGVELIHANSPQAKGRIERLFGTFQDRLVKEMRLKNISTKEEANEFLEGYLPKHNKKFSNLPVNIANLHREIPEELNLESIFSIKTKRVLKNDWTISYNNQLYQVKETPPNTRIKSVVVEERIDNTIHLTYNDIELKYKKIEKRPLKLKEEKEPLKIRKIHITPLDHPWRRFKINPYKRSFLSNTK